MGSKGDGGRDVERWGWCRAVESGLRPCTREHQPEGKCHPSFTKSPSFPVSRIALFSRAVGPAGKEQPLPRTRAL